MSAAEKPLPRSVLPRLLLLTLIFGGLNALKPVHIDDAAYFYDARQIAAHPLDPYGTWIFWWQEPQPANEILAPPVVPYTWALGLRLFGDEPALCKLLLLPWAFLLAYAVHALARRFAAGLEWPLTIVTVLSPALWPAFNYMLDLPALALGLVSIELFLRACGDGSFFKAACAGLLVGVGFETKYTACVAAAALVLAAVLWRRWALGQVAVLAAAHVVGAWEFLTAVLYERSHFMIRFTGGNSSEGSQLLAALQRMVLAKGPLVTGLLSLLGGITPALLLFGLLALGVRRRWLLLTVLLFLGGLLAVCLFDSQFDGFITPSPRFFGKQNPPWIKCELADLIFAAFGAVMLLVVVIIARSLFRTDRGETRRATVFLIGWLGLEVAAFFPLTEFPAVRRVLGILIVMTLLIGRCASQYYRTADQRLRVYAIVLFNVLLGVALFTLDFRYAEVQRAGAAQAAEWVKQRDGGRLWYTGHWGFQYYAEHNGMKPLVVEYEARPGLPEPTHLEPGDWLVVPDERVNQQLFQLDPEDLHEMGRLTFDDPIPLHTLPAFHGWTVPVQHLEGPRLQIHIYQVQRAFVPRPKPSQ